MSRRAPLVFFLTLVTAATVGAQQHPFNVHDLVAMQRVSDPQPSPDGSRAAFVVTTMDLEANAGRKDIWMAATDGSGARQLIADPADDWNPRWRDNGAFRTISVDASWCPRGCPFGPRIWEASTVNGSKATWPARTPGSA